MLFFMLKVAEYREVFSFFFVFKRMNKLVSVNFFITQHNLADSNFVHLMEIGSTELKFPFNKLKISLEI